MMTGAVRELDFCAMHCCTFLVLFLLHTSMEIGVVSL